MNSAMYTIRADYVFYITHADTFGGRIGWTHLQSVQGTIGQYYVKCKTITQPQLYSQLFTFPVCRFKTNDSNSRMSDNNEQMVEHLTDVVVTDDNADTADIRCYCLEVRRQWPHPTSRGKQQHPCRRQPRTKLPYFHRH